MEVIDPATGEDRQANIFVAVLGASSYTYAEATWTQTLPDWCGSHARAFGFFGGVSTLVIPDNLRSAVSKACRYEPDLNPTYAQMAAYFGVAVLPARPRKARDKAKAEVGVQVVERWILARLRHRTFFSLGELNEAIRALLEELNHRPFKRLPGSRREAFERLDRAALRPLPLTPYLYTEVKKATVYIDYHVEVDRHYYSEIRRGDVDTDAARLVWLACTRVWILWWRERLGDPGQLTQRRVQGVPLRAGSQSDLCADGGVFWRSSAAGEATKTQR